MPAGIDSNLLWVLLADQPTLLAREGEVGQLWLPLPVLGEARFAVLNSTRRLDNEMRLEWFLRRCVVPEMGPLTATIYADVRLALRRKGRPIPVNDMWIAAVCLEHGVPLATRDTHFDEIDGLQRLAW